MTTARSGLRERVYVVRSRRDVDTRSASPRPIKSFLSNLLGELRRSPSILSLSGAFRFPCSHGRTALLLSVRIASPPSQALIVIAPVALAYISTFTTTPAPDSLDLDVSQCAVPLCRPFLRGRVLRRDHRRIKWCETVRYRDRQSSNGRGAMTPSSRERAAKGSEVTCHEY